MAINKYPYTNFNEYNLDWLIIRIKELTVEWAETKTEWGVMKDEFQDLKDFVNDKLSDDNLESLVNDKIDEMYNNGTLMSLIASYLPFVTPEMFGAIGDGVNDDTQSFIDALAVDSALMLPNKYKITQTLTLNNKKLFGIGEIICDDLPFILIDNVNIDGITISCDDYTDLNTVGIQIAGLRNILHNIRFNNYGTAMFFHTLDVSEFRGIAYNVISDIFAYRGEMVVHGQSAGSSWFNENTFENVNLIQDTAYRTWLTSELGGSLTDSYAIRMDYDGTIQNTINNNKFINCCVEMCVYGGFYICGLENIFISCRVEGLTVPFFMPPDIVQSGHTYVNAHNFFIGCYDEYNYQQNYVRKDANDDYVYDNYIFGHRGYVLSDQLLLNTTYQKNKNGFVVEGQKVHFYFGNQIMYTCDGQANPQYITMNTRINKFAVAQYPSSSFSTPGTIDGEIRYCYTDHRYYYWNSSANAWKKFAVE